MADISVGSVSVTVVPDARGIDERLESALLPAADAVGEQIGAAIGDRIASAIGDAIARGAGDALPPARTGGGAVGATFAEAIKSKIEAALKTLPDVKLDADSTPTDQKIAAIREELVGLSGQRIGIDMSADEVLARLADVRAQLDDVGRGASVDVRVDTARASAQLAALQAQVDKLDASQALQKTGSEGGSALVAGIVGGSLLASPLLVGAMATLGATAVGALGVAIDSGSPQIQNAWARFADAGQQAAQQAAQPMVAPTVAALGQISQAFPALEADAHAAFSTAAGDVQPLVTGILDLAHNAIPGVTRGLADAQPIIAAFDSSLGGVGSALGQTFQGLAHDAQGTAQGVSALFGILDSAVSTVGRLIGDTASGIGQDLAAIQTPITGLLSALRAVSSPALDTAAAGALISAKWNPLGSIVDSAATSLIKFASVGPDVDAASVSMQGLRSAAGTAGDKLSSIGSFLGGPWGIAVGAAVAAAVPLVSALLHAADATDAVRLSTQGLETVMTQNRGVTNATVLDWIALQEQSSKLASSLSVLHVSSQQMASVVTGQKGAWLGLIAQMNAMGHAAGIQVDANGAMSISQAEYTVNLHTGIQTLNANTAAMANHIQKTLDSARAQQQQYEAEQKKIAQDKQYTNAIQDLGSKQSVLTQQQQNALLSVNALNLSSDKLNQILYTSETQYNDATNAANGYAAAVAAASGTANSLFSANTQLEQAQLNLNTALKAAHGDLTAHTQASISAQSATESFAQAAIGQATALYQSKVSTEDADKAYLDANNSLAKSKAAFENMAIAAGGSKKDVQELADELFKLPSEKDITVSVSVKSNSSQWAVVPTHGGLKGFASGGVIDAPDMGRDSVLVPMRGQEGVLVPEAARALGGAAGIDRINRAAERGQLPMRGYATGGIVQPPSYAPMVSQPATPSVLTQVLSSPAVHPVSVDVHFADAGLRDLIRVEARAQSRSDAYALTIGRR
jgi:hypothetical protein